MKQGTENRRRSTNKKYGPTGSQLTVSCWLCTVFRQCSVSGGRFPERSKTHPGLKSSVSRQLAKQWPTLKEQLEFLGTNLSKWSLVKAITVLSEARKRRFLRSKTPKYGSMNKAFTEEELGRFFNVIDEPRSHLLFSFQAFMGLRIGEAVRLTVKDINLKTRELRIFTEKTGKTDYLLIPVSLFDAAIRYIASYQKEIADAHGFLFFSYEEKQKKETTKKHLTTESARRLFNHYARIAKLDEIYGYTSGARANALHRLSPHSLRHYAITNFCRKNGGNVMLASKFARHTNLQTTMTYIHTEKNELYESIERAQNKDILDMVRRMQERI